MKIEKKEERLIKIERGNEIRTGMIVVVNPCLLCARSHRFMVVGIGSHPSPSSHPDRAGKLKAPYECEGLSLTFDPGYPCDRIDPNHMCPTNVIRGGRLFRVHDGIDRSDDEREGRELYDGPPTSWGPAEWARFELAMDHKTRERERQR